MRDMPDCGICADLTAEDYGVDFWADRAEYVNESTFNLYVTQAEENVLWNIEKKAKNRGVWRFRSSGSPCGAMEWAQPRLFRWPI